MIVADLSAQEPARRLAVVQGIALHYADHPIEQSKGFAEFQVRVATFTSTLWSTQPSSKDRAAHSFFRP